MMIVITDEFLLCNRGQFGGSFPQYGKRVMPIDRTEAQTRLARLEELVEEYRAAKQRRLLQQAVKLWRRAEADRRRMALEAQPERLH